MANRRDPVWKYVIEVEENGKKFMRCICCDRKIRGGVFRLKEHLAGAQGNVAPCLKVQPEVREEMRNYMDNFNKTKRMNQLVREERIDHCTTLNSSEFLDGSSSGSITQRRVRGPMDRFLNSAEENAAKARKGEGPRTGATDKELREQVCMDIGRYYFDNGIAFNTADSPAFVNMCRSIGRYGMGFKPPTSYELKTWILKKQEENTQKIVADVRRTWLQTGVSILSDGWKDMRNRQLINFLVNNPHGTVFLRSVDASDAVKDAALLFKLLDDVVEEIGEDIVVQVVTDNASNYKKAGEMLMEKRKKLWWTPCAAHCIDLMLEKIGELPQHRNALKKAKKVSNYIYNHGWVLALLRKYAKKDLVRAAPTRFATAYLTLQSMFEMREPLQQMFISSEWSECTYAKKPEGKEVRKIILRDGSFWSSMSYALKTIRPLVHVLRMTDSEKVPGMGFIYGSMDRAKEEIAKNLNDDFASYSEIWKIIDEKWEFQMHRPLHAAAYYLNPAIHYSENMSNHPEIKMGLFSCLDKMMPNYADKEKANMQLDAFRN